MDELARQHRLANLIQMYKALDSEDMWALDLAAEIDDEIRLTRPKPKLVEK